MQHYKRFFFSQLSRENAVMVDIADDFTRLGGRRGGLEGRAGGGQEMRLIICNGAIGRNLTGTIRAAE